MMGAMIGTLKKELPEYNIEPITEQSFSHAFTVYDTNQTFFLLTQGKEATIESSAEDITAAPPNFDISNKLYLGIWRNDDIIGILDLLKGYPNEDCIWVGLLLIHSNFHNKKIGSTIVDAVLKSAELERYKSVQLGVFGANTKGLSFWEKHGFSSIRTTKDNIIVMEKCIEI